MTFSFAFKYILVSAYIIDEAVKFQFSQIKITNSILEEELPREQ